MKPTSSRKWCARCALDSYGQYDGNQATSLLDPLVLTKERKAEIPIIGDPDETTVACIKAFYNAIAILIEKECGLMAAAGASDARRLRPRILITVGKLVVLDRTLRDVHRFGFESLSKMKNEADKYLSVAIEIIGKFPDVAGL